MENNTVVSHSKIEFSWHDYGLFLAMLAVSALIGVYFGFIKKQSTADDYLLGGREMSSFPIAMSITSSVISGITLLAMPTDIYRYGATWGLNGLMLLFAIIISYYFCLPVFYDLQITSSYEYLERRFDRNVRVFASVCFTLSQILHLPIVMYIPALALSQATGIDIFSITPVLCGVCIFYTTFGGLKAVVWTDALQLVVMFGATFIILFLGITSAGGVGRIWKENMAYGRLDIDFDADITKRDTLWTGVFGGFFMWFCYTACNQGFIQKCNALPNYKSVRNAATMFGIGAMVLVCSSVLLGLIMFAKYSNCDPLSAGYIQEPDQLLPHFIMDVGQSVPGISGLFTAGIFSAGLSTLSASINCLSATTYEDFVSRFIKKGTSEKIISNYLKIIAVVIGIICTGLVYIVPYLGSLLPLALSVGGITQGTLLGLFLCGMLLPNINAVGVLWGGIASLSIMSWIVFGAQYYKSMHIITFPGLPTTTEGCQNFTAANDILRKTEFHSRSLNDKPFILYRISYYHYWLMGTFIVVAIGCIVSKFTSRCNKPVEKRFFSPLIRNMLGTEDYPPQYYDLEHIKEIVTDARQM